MFLFLCSLFILIEMFKRFYKFYALYEGNQM
jgi:hypothetical protein